MKHLEGGDTQVLALTTLGSTNHKCIGPSPRGHPNCNVCIVPSDIVAAQPIHSPQSAYLHDVSIAREDPRDPSARASTPVLAVHVRSVIVDSGAGVSVMTTDLLRELPKDAYLQLQRQPDVKQIKGANGEELPIVGGVYATFCIQGYAYHHSFRVLAGPPTMILGNDFLAPLNATLSLKPAAEGGSVLRLPKCVCQCETPVGCDEFLAGHAISPV